MSYKPEMCEHQNNAAKCPCRREAATSPPPDTSWMTFETVRDSSAFADACLIVSALIVGASFLWLLLGSR